MNNWKRVNSNELNQMYGYLSLSSDIDQSRKTIFLEYRECNNDELSEFVNKQQDLGYQIIISNFHDPEWKGDDYYIPILEFMYSHNIKKYIEPNINESIVDKDKVKLSKGKFWIMGIETGDFAHSTNTISHVFNTQSLEKIIEHQNRFKKRYKASFICSNNHEHRLDLVHRIYNSISTEHLHLLLPYEYKDDEVVGDYIKNIQPLISDGWKEEYGRVPGEYVNFAKYLDSYIEIIHPPTMRNIFFTDKWMKSIFTMKPSIIIGSNGIYEYLDKHGFEPYTILTEDWKQWDGNAKGKDSNPHLNKIHRCMDNVNKITDMSYSDIGSWYNDQSEILYHNTDVFFNKYIPNMRKEFEEFVNE